MSDVPSALQTFSPQPHGSTLEQPAPLPVQCGPPVASKSCPHAAHWSGASFDDAPWQSEEEVVASAVRANASSSSSSSNGDGGGGGGGSGGGSFAPAAASPTRAPSVIQNGGKNCQLFPVARLCDGGGYKRSVWKSCR